MSLPDVRVPRRTFLFHGQAEWVLHEDFVRVVGALASELEVCRSEIGVLRASNADLQLDRNRAVMEANEGRLAKAIARNTAQAVQIGDFRDELARALAAMRGADRALRAPGVAHDPPTPEEREVLNPLAEAIEAATELLRATEPDRRVVAPDQEL